MRNIISKERNRAAKSSPGYEPFSFQEKDLTQAFDYIYNMDNNIFDELIQKSSKFLAEEVMGILNKDIEEYRKMNPFYYSESSNKWKNNYRSGYKKVKLSIPVFLTFDILIPKFRGGKLESPYLTKLMEEIDRYIISLIYSLYVSNISYDKIAMILNRLGIKMSHQTVANKLKKLTKLMEEYENRSLSDKQIKYIMTDAIYVKDKSSIKQDKALLAVLGITENGEREILGYSIDYSESELSYYRLFKRLEKRGLNMENVDMVISDGHKGIAKYMINHNPDIKHQICLFHLSNNILKGINFKTNPTLKKSMYADIFWIITPNFLQDARNKGDRTFNKLLKRRIKYIEYKWRKKNLNKEADKLINNIETSLVSIRSLNNMKKAYKLSTSNTIERYFRDYRKFSYGKRAFYDEKSIKRLTNLIVLDINYRIKKKDNLW